MAAVVCDVAPDGDVEAMRPPRRERPRESRCARSWDPPGVEEPTDASEARLDRRRWRRSASAAAFGHPPVDTLEILEPRELDRQRDLAAGAESRSHPGLEVVARAAPRARADPGGRSSCRGVRARVGVACRRSRSADASSTSRTDKSSLTRALRSASWNARSGVPSNARACPIRERSLLARARWIDGGSWRSRSVFVTVGAALPDRRRDLFVGQSRSLRSSAGRPRPPRAG